MRDEAMAADRLRPGTKRTKILPSDQKEKVDVGDIEQLKRNRSAFGDSSGFG
jgi:hypothetical protein